MTRTKNGRTGQRRARPSGDLLGLKRKGPRDDSPRPAPNPASKTAPDPMPPFTDTASRIEDLLKVVSSARPKSPCARRQVIVERVRYHAKSLKVGNDLRADTRLTLCPVPTIISPNSAGTELDGDPPLKIDAGDTFERLLADCDRVAEGRSVFGIAHDHIRRALVPAYAVFNAIKSDPSTHARLIAHLKRKHGRRRAGSTKKPALNAVIAACHPSNIAEGKLCSDWANVLVLADLEGVRKADFARWVAERGINDSKNRIRELQSPKPRQKKASRIKLPFAEYEFPIIAQALAINDRVCLELLREALKRTETFLRGPTDPRPTNDSTVQLQLPFSP